MYRKTRMVSWIVLICITAFIVLLYTLFSIGLKTRKNRMFEEYNTLLNTQTELTNRKDSLKAQLNNSKSDNEIIENARRNNYLTQQEILIHISFPDDFDENQIYNSEMYYPSK